MQDLRDQLRTSSLFVSPENSAVRPMSSENGRRRSSLRGMKTRLDGIDAVEVPQEERESVESSLEKTVIFCSCSYGRRFGETVGRLLLVGSRSLSSPMRHPGAHG